MLDKKGVTKVVLVEDDADDVEFFQEAVSDLSYDIKVTVYRNGQEFMDGIQAEKTELPDLVFLDLNMPIKNGVQTLKELRNIPEFQKIPVVAIYSTLRSESDHAQTFLLGADAFITKPTDYKEMKKIIKTLFDIDWKNRNTEKKNFVISPI